MKISICVEVDFLVDLTARAVEKRLGSMVGSQPSLVEEELPHG